MMFFGINDMVDKTGKMTEDKESEEHYIILITGDIRL